MKTGNKFTFYSNGKHKKAIFLEEINNNKIKCVICDEKMAGINIEISKSQIIDENQISMF